VDTSRRLSVSPAIGGTSKGDNGVVGPSSAVDAVVDWYGVVDLHAMPRRHTATEMSRRLPPELRVPPENLLTRGLSGTALADANPISHVSSAAPPFLIMHGTHDVVVPHTQSEALAASLRRAGVPARLELVAGAGHVFGGHDDIDALVRTSVEFLGEALFIPSDSHP
jgi:dipeptidyl aminopeptidase/acylaminoacyl peptidase